MFGGHLMKHYGHFLIESMSRLWARELYPTLPILFTNHPKWQEAMFGMEVLDALGLRHRTLLVEKPTIFREVICPGTAFEYRWKVFAGADEPHVAVTGVLETAGRRTWRQPVYLTRSGLSDDLRKSEAEPELESELMKRGFEIVRAETLPLVDQICLFEQSPIIVGTVGSALHTALFSRSSQTRLGIVNWGRGFENYLLVDAVKRHTSYYLKGINRPKEGGELVLDVGRTLQLLGEAGLITA
jgi:capsular polysaccharide biosynthesis protein